MVLKATPVTNGTLPRWRPIVHALIKAASHYIHDFRFNRNNEPFGYWKWRERGVSMDPGPDSSKEGLFDESCLANCRRGLEGQCLRLL